MRIRDFRAGVRMSEMSAGRALRDIQQAQAELRKIRGALRAVRGSGRDPEAVLRGGWEALTGAHRVFASIPWTAVDDEVMLRLAAAQRYATALLVRLRRLARGDAAGLDDDEGDE